MTPRARGKATDARASELSARRRKLVAPFAARLLAVTPIRSSCLRTSVIADVLTTVLAVHTDERTVRNYLAMRTRTDALLVPNDFEERLRRARLRPAARDYVVVPGDDALLRLLRDVQHEAMKSAEHCEMTETVVREIEYVNPGERSSHSTGRRSLEDGQTLEFGYDSEDGQGALRQVVRRDSFIDDENFALWWGQFASGRSDWIPEWVERKLARTGGKRSLGYRTTGVPEAMADFVDLGKKMKAERRARRRMTVHEVCRDFEKAKSSGCSSATYYEKNEYRMPDSIGSLRTFQRRFAEWKRSREPDQG